MQLTLSTHMLPYWRQNTSHCDNLRVKRAKKEKTRVYIVLINAIVSCHSYEIAMKYFTG